MTSRPSTPADHGAWSARFGWILGGVLGLIAGFAGTYLVELSLRGRVADPASGAGRAASLVVPALFVAGALGGHALGARAGAARYKGLGIAAGFALAALGWAVLVIAR